MCAAARFHPTTLCTTTQAQERALWLEHHITEVLDGIPVGAVRRLSPRNGYDPTTVSLRQRERTKSPN